MGRGTCHGSPETDLGKGGGGKLIGFTRKEDLELQERNFLAVQWLGLHAEGAGSIPGGGTEILQAVRCSQKKVKGRIIIHVFCLFYFSFSFFFFFLKEMKCKTYEVESI